MPTRLIREGILTSERIASLNWEAEVFYRRLMSVADDYGLYDARPAILRSALYPLQLEKMSECNIQRCLAACETAGLILLFVRNGKSFLQIQNFGQQIKSKPKYPLPSDADLINPLRNDTEPHNPLRTVTSRNESLPSVTKSKSNTESYTESKSNANKKEKEAEDQYTVVRRSAASAAIEPYPLSVDEVVAVIMPEVTRGTILLKPEAVHECAEKYFASREVRGWLDNGRTPVPIKKWTADAKTYARAWARNVNASRPESGPLESMPCLNENNQLNQPN